MYSDALDGGVSRPQRSNSLSAYCHVDEIPAFVEAELIRLYGHLFSTMQYLRLFKKLDRASTYLVRRDGVIVTLLLFKIESGTVVVLNEIFRLDQGDLIRFAKFIFSSYRAVASIRFNDIETSIDSLPFPHQKYQSRQDFVVFPPGSKEHYTASLGKATRHNIRRYSTRLIQDHPGVECHFFEKEEVDERHVRTLIQMSAAKMALKNQRFGITEAYADHMVTLAKICGFVSVMTLERRVIAGLICYRTGNHVLAHVVAHDPAFDQYWLGTNCYYRTICEAIDRGATVFNMSRQFYDYKTRLLGQPVDLQRVELYRSRASMIINFFIPVRMACEKGLHKARSWLREHRSSVITRSILGAAHMVRTLRLKVAR